MLAAHLCPLLFGVGLGRDGDARDRDLLRDDRIHGAGKAQLHRPAHLPAVERALNKRGHDRAERADVEEVMAHPVTKLAVDVGRAFFGGLQIAVDPERSNGFVVAAVERHAVFDVNAVAGGILLERFDIIADLPLEADVCHEAVAGLGVDAGHIAGVGVAIGVAVFDVEQDDKIIAVSDGFGHVHFLLTVSSRNVSASDDSSRSRMRPAPAASCVRETARSSGS